MLVAMISQPMSGLSTQQIQETRNRATQFLENNGYTVLNTYITNPSIDINPDYPIKNSSVFYLAKSIEYMSRCDTVFFTLGWKNARGCLIEHEIAKNYGLTIIYEE